MGERPHKRLKVWQSAVEVVELTYRLTEQFPKAEQFGLVAQMRRAAVSIPTNIAEGAARRSTKEALQFYFVARGSLSELDTLTDVSQRLRLNTDGDYKAYVDKMTETSLLLQGLITHNQRRSV